MKNIFVGTCTFAFALCRSPFITGTGTVKMFSHGLVQMTFYYF